MKRFFRMILLCLIIVMCSGCGTKPGPTWQYTDIAMGTIIQQHIYAADDEAAQKTSHQVMSLINDLEDRQISWREESSELAKINATAGTGESVVLSPEMASVLQQCMDVWEKSDGAFDITIGSVARLWNIDAWAAGEQEGNFVLPDATTIQEALQNSGSGKIAEQVKTVIGHIGETDNHTEGTNNAGTVTLSLPYGMQLDLGAVGKGLVLSYIHDLLKEQNEITAAIISAGGSILIYGIKPDGSNWNVGIVDPLDTSQSIATLSLESGWYIATSGDTERYVEVDGVRYHHILNPSTGYPADSGVRSVTIISQDGLLSDALSTACFVLGVEKGMELAESYGAEAFFVLEGRDVVMSEGLVEDSTGLIHCCSQSP